MMDKLADLLDSGIEVGGRSTPFCEGGGPCDDYLDLAFAG
jgi:hypothetical protein